MRVFLFNVFDIIINGWPPSINERPAASNRRNTHDGRIFGHEQLFVRGGVVDGQSLPRGVSRHEIGEPLLDVGQLIVERRAQAQIVGVAIRTNSAGYSKVVTYKQHRGRPADKRFI